MNLTKKVPFISFHLITAVVFKIEMELEKKLGITEENSVSILHIQLVRD